MAPAAKIYALKVVDSTIGFASEDGILAAFDRVITLKKNFLAGKPPVPVSGTGAEDDPFVYDSLDIKVVNFSIGGPTLAAGRDLFSRLEQQFLALGITIAAAASNAGPAGFTVGAAASGLGALSVGATSDPIHERIVADMFGNPDGCDLSFGNAFRPNNTLQMASFSSRGGTADGRIGVDVAAPGDWNLVQSPNGESRPSSAAHRFPRRRWRGRLRYCGRALRMREPPRYAMHSSKAQTLIFSEMSQTCSITAGDFSMSPSP